MKIEFLNNEPRPNTWYKQLLFYFTRPIAKMVDAVNYDKQEAIRIKREEISKLQKTDFIIEVANILYAEVLTHGEPQNKELCRMLCVDEARDIFYQKKYNGGFDDLNIIIE